jgi:hypothetical protein
MRVVEPNVPAANTDVPASGRIVTTLYDLIESLNVQVMPGEDDLVITAMKNILNTRRLTFLELPFAPRVKCA